MNKENVSRLKNKRKRKTYIKIKSEKEIVKEEIINSKEWKVVKNAEGQDEAIKEG